MTVDGEEFAQTLRVEPDPVVAEAVTAYDEQPVIDEEEEEHEIELEQEREREGRNIDKEIGD